MKTLLTNGDSWTQGDSPAQNINWKSKMDLGWYNIVPQFGRGIDFNMPKQPRAMAKFYDSEVWPKALGRLLDVETWNAGRLGDDNQGILHSTVRSVEWLLSQGKDDIFVIVGWSSPLRVPVFKEFEGKYRLAQARPHDENMAIPLDKFEHTFNMDLTSIMCYLSLQNYLDSRNIDYLFFNAFDNVQSIDKYAGMNLNLSKWVDEKVVYPHFDSYIKDKYHLSDNSNTKYYGINHPTDICHTAWAEHLYSILNE
jgi:hypothetical protein